MKYAELVKQGQRLLFKAGIADYSIDAWILFEKICNISKTEYFEKMHVEVPEDEKKSFFEAIDRRITHYPLQYIVGEWEFMGLKFKVNENVLIPRQDTEFLVETAFSMIKEEFPKRKDTITVLDMCTGSGCIGISIAKYIQNSFVVCVDVMEEALEVAKENARLNGVENIKFVRSDLFQNIEEKFDVIISNPPYIKTSECERLMPEVRDYEPRIALDGDEDGLRFYRNIIRESKDYFKGDAYLLFEIGYDQREEVKELLEKGGFDEIEALKDLAGNDRVLIGKRRI